MHGLRDALVRIAEEEQPATVRHLFYVAVTRGLVPKTEAAYKGVIVRLLTQLRRSGAIPYHWIADNTRWILQGRTYDSPAEAVEEAARLYRRNLWTTAPERVEVWTEKDAIAGIVSREAYRWNVPTMVFRGYSSVSYLYTLAEEIRERGLPTFVYYFGDHDPSGLDIERYVTRTVRELAPEAEIHVERLAVTRKQIKTYSLPTRPTKTTDTRARHFTGESVEVDALSPRILEEMTQAAIFRHLDMDEAVRLQTVEQEEKAALRRFAEAFRGAA